MKKATPWKGVRAGWTALRRTNPWLGRTIVAFLALDAAAERVRPAWYFFIEYAPRGAGWDYVTGLLSSVTFTLMLALPNVVAAFAFVAAFVTIFRAIRKVPAGTPNDPLIRLRNLLRRRRWVAPTLLLSPLPFVAWRTVEEHSALLADRAELLNILQTAAVPTTARMAENAPLVTSHLTNSLHGLELEGVARATSLLLLVLLVYCTGKLLVLALDRLPDRAVGAPVETPEPEALHQDEVTFRAVAVTARAQALVIAMAAFIILALVGLCNLTLHAWIHSAWLTPAVASYAVAILVAQYWFRRASTVGIGVDGVLIQGTSKTRFYPYRAFDDVRAAGPELFLTADNRTRLRLQLHGADKARGEVLKERMIQALQLSKRTLGAEMAVAVHGAGAGGDYRAPSLDRDQLWELIEGDGTSTEARTAAARALARDLAATERDRLRIAGARCADPRVRIVIDELTATDPAAEEAARSNVRT